MNEHAQAAWSLLRAVEDGRAEYVDVADQVQAEMAVARDIASTGTILARVEALAYVEAGDYDSAARAARESLSWQRDHVEQSDAWVTLARIELAKGNTSSAAQAIGEARHQWPDNPRLSLFEIVSQPS
ncbi:MAG: tetratricopeptide repeat protein [Candidatus Nanopelagicales bacterium]